jgi:DNA processing protein
MTEASNLVNFLLAQQGVGNMTVVKLYRSYPLFENLISDFEKNEKVPVNVKRLIFNWLSSKSKYNVDSYDEVVSIWDKNYPWILKEIYDPPVRLFYKGNIDILNKKSISIVGTRKMSSYGKRATKKLVSHLSELPILTVSGMAFGIDSVTHYESIKNNLPTCAVLASSLDNVMPKQNITLFDAIVDNSGLVISEYPSGTSVVPGMFASRNRIIAGLSSVTVVVEAGKKSGALITARLALDYNREVFAIPGSIFSELSLGNNSIIAKGEACLLFDFDQILKSLGLKRDSKGGARKVVKLTPEQEFIVKIFRKYTILSADEVKILSKNSNSLSILSELEILGVVERVSGKYSLV